MKDKKNKNLTKRRRNTKTNTKTKPKPKPKDRKKMSSRKARGFFWSSKPKQDPCAMLKETIDDQELYIKDLLKRIADLKTVISRNTGFNSRVENQTPKRINSTETRRRISKGVLFNPKTSKFEEIEPTYYVEGKII